MKATYLIGGLSPFPLITDFLAYAIARTEASANSSTVKEVKNELSRQSNRR